MADTERVQSDSTTVRESELTDDQIVELFERYSPSVPIRIPTNKLSAEFEYRWINRRNPNVFTRRKGVGWRPVTMDELEELVLSPHTVEDLHLGTHVTADGLVAISDDLVLAKIPKRYANAYRKHREQKNKERREAGRRRFHQAGEMLGVSTEETA